AFGIFAMQNATSTTPFNNLAVGFGALFGSASNFAGVGNTALGNLTLQSNSTGVLNVAVGLSALNANTSGSQNTAVGESAGLVNSTGSDNTIIGNASLSNSVD